ncbi:MAG: exodeoxyribonuclease VII small subunit [Thermoguttaceae bacterium]
MAAAPSGKISKDDQEQLSDAPSFEQTLCRLEEIVQLLEEGRIGLDEALGRYEEGVGLLRKAYELLERAQRRISLLSGVDSEGNPILRPMEDAASFSLDREVAGPAPVVGAHEKANSPRGRRQVESDSP